MAKGARSKRVKRNNTAKRERLAKFENQKLEVISQKLSKLIYGDEEEMDIDGLPKLETDNLKSIAEVIITNDKKVNIDNIMDVDDTEKEKSTENVHRRRRSKRS